MTLGAYAPAGNVKNPAGLAQWLRFGLPLERGVSKNPASLQLVSEGGEAMDSEFHVLARWHDGSIQWVLVDTIMNASALVYVRTGQAGGKPLSGFRDGAGSIEGRIEGVVGNDGKIRLGNGIDASLSITVGGTPRRLSLVRKHSECGDICHEHRGLFAVEGIPDLHLSLSACEIARTGQTELRAQVHNLAASVHPNGCWDLGDPNSVLIENLSLTVADEQAVKTSLALHDQAPQGEQTAEIHGNGRLFQYGSGGEHWDSPVHVDKSGRSPVAERGFKFFDDQGELLSSGLRAKPRVWFGHETLTRSAVLRQFWENFPSALELKDSRAIWHLFPEDTELQPGEAKTWICDIGFAECSEKPRAEFAYNPIYIDETNALLGCRVSFENALSDLVDSNVSGPGSFYRKREACDEYGWRNFGELYADHEALSVTGDDIFVSHYNNQYDPVWGFSLRFLGAGDQRWQDLASDLAQHVVDIDIYKTDRDKAEYNNGLFWHTDHYLPALTATHRTYSRGHDYAYEGHQGGGGPGGQHCYSSGLALRYLLTGDEALKQAVFGLCGWIRYFYNGAPTVLARLHRLITVDLNADKMTNVGFIEAGYKYPLDRGTGNYLNTLIDAYLISQDAPLLDEMYGVIVETISPDDDPAARNLGKVEEHWFYIVFLQSLARFLLLKEQLAQVDHQYAYARHTLIHYADWILDNEKPYLSNPEALEFPTDTWAAQDIRKANVLYYSAYFNPARKDILTAKAEEFWRYCVNTLTQSPERHTTRIQAILAQNLGVREWCLEKQSSPYPLPGLQELRIKKNGAGKRFIRDILVTLRSFSISHEIEWLKGRFGGR
ncbi:hypothetical protein [Marinobacter changyiensis]|uniref:RIFT barrel domain-containing protein n=1 Tax=Marinobacter changyiensis TaxID=2604091 RepID=UPI001FE527E2|nr:hypothetical protein [Marinobacter changyiensis]